MDQLEYLARAYFHPDWNVEASTPAGAMRNFVRDEPPEDVAQLGEELVLLLSANPTEQELHDVWQHKSGASWDPVITGWGTYRQWFQAMLAAVS
ncbi:hypothetical protein GCM10025864_35040 [Luteimicrobium album]|uniref:CdiI immunity protein domain-containing protein n=1 Tax=Luteimicrobium album TaxID=1054550 RepID=A0ABQ6I5I3_9MICO|nr:contact-dependent growth inhibition system immunity protein [Luteimicrobium album]GMA25745.1 hypothetical protein GCM10025864_35040 [Luteimicrobium album]